MYFIYSDFSHKGHKGHKEISEEVSPSNLPLMIRLIPFFRCASPKLMSRPSLRSVIRSWVSTCLACKAESDSTDFNSAITFESTRRSARKAARSGRRQGDWHRLLSLDR